MIDYAKLYAGMADKCQPGSKAERKFRLLSLAYAKLGLGAWRGNVLILVLVDVGLGPIYR